MGRLTIQEMNDLIQHFLSYLESKSCLGLAIKKKVLKEEAYYDFRKKRLSQNQKVTCFSTVLYFMKRKGLAVHSYNGTIILAPNATPNATRQHFQNQRSARRKIRTSKMDKVKKILDTEMDQHSSLQGIEVACVPPTIELEFGVYLRSMQDQEVCGEMKIVVSNNSVMDIVLSNARFLSKGKDFFFVDKISQSQPVKIHVGSNYEIVIGCHNFWRDVGACTTEVMLQFSSCKKSENQQVSNVIRCIRFEKTNRIVDELKPEKPFLAMRKRLRRKFGSVVAGMRPPIITGNNLEREEKLDIYPVPNNIKEAVASNAFIKKGNSSSKFKYFRAMLESSLDKSTYREKLNMLLHMEELQCIIEMQQYDLTAVTMDKSKKLLFLKIPGLAEKRPSVLRGDQIFASLTSAPSDGPLREYQGYVHVVERDQVGVGFNSQLLNIHNSSTKYNVRFTVNRLPVRLAHRAITLKLPPELTFPEKSKVLYSDIKISSGDLKNELISKNPEQRKAVNEIVCGKTTSVPYVIFGPPGTGKTITMVEAIHQIRLIYEECHILVCAPSNSSCDLLTSLLLEHIQPSNILRMHASSRAWNDVPPKVQNVSNHDGADFYFPSKRDLYDYEVIVCTLVTAGRLASAKFPGDHFTHVFIDEAGQATEPEAMVSIGGILAQRGQVVLAGDPKQLGPLLLSPVAEEFGLGMSYLERLMDTEPLYQKDNTQSYDTKYITKLLYNYRSRKEIIQISNELFYENELRVCVDETKLCNIESFSPSRFPVIFEGVRGEDLRESSSPSFYNPQEISVISSYIDRLFANGISGDQVGIITPYRKQVQKIKRVIGECGVKVGSVEEFQGQERQIIIISTVRSDSQHLLFDTAHCLGFLSNPKRFNVAITRAKSLLVIIGNPHLLSLDFHWRRILTYCCENGTYRGIPFELNESTEDVADDGSLEKLLEELHIS